MTYVFSPANTCSLIRKSVRNLGRRNPLAKTLDAFRLVGPKRMADSLGPRVGSIGPDYAHGHSRTKVGDALASELGGHAVTIARGINHGADLHHSCSDRARGITDEHQTYRCAVSRTLGGGLGNLELDLEGRKLAHAETFVAFGDLLPFANVANDNSPGKG